MKYLNTKPGSIEEVAANMSKYATESEYQDMFKKELEKAGKGIGSMTPAEKKAFFNKIDSKYKADNEEVSQKEIDKFHTSLDKLVHKSFGHSSDEKKKEMKNEQAKNPYAIGMAAAMKATGDKPPLSKSTITKAHDIAKSIEKDQKKEEKDVPKGYHKMPDGTVMKDSEHKKEVKETHTFITQKINQKKKSAPGEKDVVDPEPKLSEPKAKLNFKETYKKMKKEAMNTIGDANAEKANQLVIQKDDSNDPDIKKPKGKTDAGTKPSPVDTSPEVEYKN